MLRCPIGILFASFALQSVAFGQSRTFLRDSLVAVCNDYASLDRFQSISGEYTYKDWENISKKATYVFKPSLPAGRCITNSLDFVFTFQRAAGDRNPPTEIDVRFGSSDGVNFKVDYKLSNSDCEGQGTKFWREFMKRKQIPYDMGVADKMDHSMRNSYCVELKKSFLQKFETLL
jgi:hypothetical protein